MSLQRRLTLIFVFVVSVPLAAAGFVVYRAVTGEIGRHAIESLAPALDANVVRYNDRVAALDNLVKASVGRPKLASLAQNGDREAIDVFLQRSLRLTHYLDFLVVLDRQGHVAGSAQNPAYFLPGFSPPRPSSLIHKSHGPGYVATLVPIRVVGRGRIGSVVGGTWLDNDFLVPAHGSIELAVTAGDTIIAATAPISHPLHVDLSFGDPFTIDLSGPATAQARRLNGTAMSIVAATPSAPVDALSRRVLSSLFVLLAVALVGTAALAYLLARFITRDLNELSKGARAITEGRFDYRIPVRSKGEIAQLAKAFNEMTEQLKGTVTELSTSRDQLSRAVRRVGETLRSTHDMKQMLDSILNTAADAVGADAAALWTFTPTRDALSPLLAKGVEMSKLGRVPVGAGVVGLVAERATTVLLPGEPGGPSPALGEPLYPTAIAIPLYSQDRIMGVLATYRSDSSNPFKREDLDTVAFLTEQGRVAVENVSLHEETRRLSLTDGLTGLWNRRYFEMQFRQVLATAHRFDRPFSILMLDLDHFKRVNDTYGHQRGDAALVEFAQRVNHVIREVDTFARYGGEEFICLLSETEIYGALTTAAKVREVIRSEPIGGVGEEPFNLTVSIGVASYPQHGESFHALVEAADRALYRAKREGRDRVCEAQPPSRPPGLKVAR
jgi:two-component system, cell cycle response regulator